VAGSEKTDLAETLRMEDRDPVAERMVSAQVHAPLAIAAAVTRLAEAIESHDG